MPKPLLIGSFSVASSSRVCYCLKATSHSAIFYTCVGAIKGTDNVLPAKDSPHCIFLNCCYDINQSNHVEVSPYNSIPRQVQKLV